MNETLYGRIAMLNDAMAALEEHLADAADGAEQQIIEEDKAELWQLQRSLHAAARLIREKVFGVPL